MNNIITPKTFIFLSQIIKIPVIDSATGKKIGTTVDICATLKEMYPKASAVVMRKSWSNKKFYLPWKQVKKIEEEKAIFVECLPEIFAQEFKLPEGEILLKDTFWDKQIVDISGSKIVRVNDLHFLQEAGCLWVAHMDIGITGIARRLGWLNFLKFIVKLVSDYELTDKFISWKFVQPITSSIGAEALSLKVKHSHLSELHPADVADIVSDLGTDERIAILNFMDSEVAGDTFQQLPTKVKTQMAEMLEPNRLLNIVNNMDTDEAVDLLSQLSKSKTHSLLAGLPKEKSQQIRELLQHSSHVAGSIMNTEFLTARHNETAGVVLERVRGESKKKESIYHVYIIDEKDALIGVVTLRQLLTAPPEKIVYEFMRKRVTKVKVNTNVKEVAEIFYKYDFTVVPVVNKDNKMQGIITMKDAFETVFPRIRQETEEAS
jgi:CBS domain-containing protein/sporulation protein YlmC with PRC-barrel domain